MKFYILYSSLHCRTMLWVYIEEPKPQMTYSTCPDVLQGKYYVNTWFNKWLTAHNEVLKTITLCTGCGI